MYLADEVETVLLGNNIGDALSQGMVIFLRGHLGAGKTTLVRGILQSAGHQGAVKSPTYTLVEPYQFDRKTIYHFDLYRLADPEELEYVGIRDYFGEQSVCLIEWDERGRGVLPEPDLIIELCKDGEGRRCEFVPRSNKGESVLKALEV